MDVKESYDLKLMQKGINFWQLSSVYTCFGAAINSVSPVSTARTAVGQSRERFSLGEWTTVDVYRLDRR